MGLLHPKTNKSSPLAKRKWGNKGVRYTQKENCSQLYLHLWLVLLEWGHKRCYLYPLSLPDQIQGNASLALLNNQDINLQTERTKEKVSGQKLLTSSKASSFEQKRQFLFEFKPVQPKTGSLHFFSKFDESFKCTKQINALKLFSSMREYFKPNNLFNEKKLQQVCIDAQLTR